MAQNSLKKQHFVLREKKENECQLLSARKTTLNKHETQDKMGTEASKQK